MDFKYAWKSSILVFLLSMSLCSAASDLKIVDMWKCPMPQKNVKGAGYADVPDVTHSLVFRPSFASGGYGHHAKIIFFKGKFYAMWSNQKYGEDGPGQKIYYATSPDGKKWGKHMVLFKSMHKEAPWGKVGISLSAQKWIKIKGRLYARAWCGETIGWADRKKTAVRKERSRKFCYPVWKRYNSLFREVMPDGKLGPVTSFTPQQIPENTLVKVKNAKAVYPKLKIHKVNLDTRKVVKDTKRRLCERVIYKTKDDCFVALFRDDNYSHRKWVSFSKDGKAWTPARPTNIPDSPSASIAMELEDGTILLVGNHMAPEFDKDSPRHYGRDPLMLSISKDGRHFTKSYAIRSGKHKYIIPREVVRGRGGGAQYPDMIKVGNVIYVIYSKGKEEIWVSSFPLEAIGIELKTRTQGGNK